MIIDFQKPWADAALLLAAFTAFALAVAGQVAPKQRSVPIRLAAALVPPQMGPDGRGREADIISAAFEATGESRDIIFHVMPFTRHWQAYKADSRYDGVTTVTDDIGIEGRRSAPYVHFQNGVIYRRADFPAGLGPDPLMSLTGRKVVSFAGAATILPEVSAVSRSAALYTERADQLIHTVMFAKNRVDAVIADELIFAHYTRDYLGGDYDAFAQVIVFDPVFCPTPYHLVFRSEELRARFDSGLETIRRDGRLDLIEARYAVAGLTKLPPRQRRC
jgi:polar amino acid transport system substrate-binding protein